MKVLFVHQNFPGQYLQLARHLGATPGNQVVFITQRTDASLPGVNNIVYKPQRSVTKGLHQTCAKPRPVCSMPRTWRAWRWI